MADFTQTKHTFISHQSLTHPGMLEGTADDVSGYLEGLVTVKVANVETTANATGVMVWIQGSFDTSGDDGWFDLETFSGSTTAAETEALTATEPVGETTLAMASTTNLTVGDWIYVADAGTVADGEWHKITKVTTNTSIGIDYGLAVQKDSADSVYTEADIFKLHLFSLGGLKRINVLVVHEAATGSNVHVLAEGTFVTAIE